MIKNKTIVVNLLGGPGIGKSTLAAELYADMKNLGLSAELVREAAKDFAWENRKITKYHQFYVVSEQVLRESILYGKVRYIITDSPIILGPIYEKRYFNSEMSKSGIFNILQETKKDGIVRYNFLLTRDKPYSYSGRYETEDQAKELDDYILDYLNKNNLPFIKSNNKVQILQTVMRDENQ